MSIFPSGWRLIEMVTGLVWRVNDYGHSMMHFTGFSRAFGDFAHGHECDQTH